MSTGAWSSNMSRTRASCWRFSSPLPLLFVLLAVLFPSLQQCNSFVPSQKYIDNLQRRHNRVINDVIQQKKSSFPSESITTSTFASTTTQLHYLLGGARRRRENGDEQAAKKVPYIVERIGSRPYGEKDYEDIATMCINIFFKEQGNNASPGERIAPWKEAQLSYLRTLQTQDLKRRRKRFPNSNEMFVAYEVLRVDAQTAWSMKKPLLLDLNKIINLPPPPPRSSSPRNNIMNRGVPEYVRGPIIGFVEITQRPYGLGKMESYSGNNIKSYDIDDEIRPVLTNLAVAKHARQSGVGSKLLQDCERWVVQQWNMKEIVLEVEDFNDDALEFYKRRGYQVLYRDPASRRFDVSGLVLRKVRCTREIMRKSLIAQVAENASDEIRMNQQQQSMFRFWDQFRQPMRPSNEVTSARY